MSAVPETTNIPSNLDFAQQVRAERLGILWKVTVVIAFVLIWAVLILNALRASLFVEVVGPTLLIFIGCGFASLALKRNRYEMAVWGYTFGLMAAFALMMIPPPDVTAAESGRDMIAFMFPLLILLVGLLMPARAAYLVLVISLGVTLVMPSIGRPSLEVGQAQFFAILLMFIATGIAAQTSGEVYGIAEWALESYRKERRVKEQLFDSQQELQRSYARQKALADQLQQANQELEKARAEAEEAKNFRGQFLANMSHELRTPLNAVIGFSETMLNFPMMYNNEPLPAAYRADMLQIYNSGRHLLQIINDILDLSKVDAGRLEMEIEQVELGPVLNGVLSTAVGLVGEKPIEIRRDFADALPPVKADPLRIRQVILNLLSNAAKFTDEGSITLGARDHGDGNVLIWLRDTGIGIPPEDVDRIFEEFRQGVGGRRRGRAGSGLGLAISRQLLNLMGGRIWVESAPGQGSTFYFTLPVYVEESVPEQQG